VKSDHPKHTQIMRILRSRIVRGTYTGRLPGERALARELGTNPKTVQVALVHLEALGLVRREQRKGTFAVPRKKHSVATGLVYARLVLRPPYTNRGRAVFWASVIIYAFQKAAQDRGVSMALEYSDDVDSVVKEAIAEARTPACVGTCLVSVPLKTRHVIRLADAGGPVVSADWRLEEPLIPWLTFDNIGAGRRAMEHLTGLGHRRIVFLRTPQTSPSQEDRERGMASYLDGLGRRLEVMTAGLSEVPEVFSTLMSRPTPPTAFVTSSVLLADMLVELAENADIDVPGDLSLMSFPGAPHHLRREITGVRMDHEALGRRAFEMLFDEELAANPAHVLLPVTLDEQDTTAQARE